jgi:hypothetical protein
MCVDVLLCCVLMLEDDVCWKVDGQELEGRWSGRWSDIFDLFVPICLSFRPI